MQDSRAEQPAEIDAESSACVIYERRNIRRENVTVQNGDEPQVMEVWTYEQRAWPRYEFMRMQQELEGPATRAIMQSISELELSIAMAALGEV